MRSCKKCGGKIPSYIKVDGKARNLCNRFYCLTCSPFNQHNTRRLSEHGFHTDRALRKAGVPCTCQNCGKPYKYLPEKGLSKNHCGSCLSRQRRVRIKSAGVALLGGKCTRCGYDKCLSALAFHHKDPKDKRFSITNNINRSWEVIRKELKKCILLCMNCHAETHEELNKLIRVAPKHYGDAPS